MDTTLSAPPEGSGVGSESDLVELLPNVPLPELAGSATSVDAVHVGPSHVLAVAEAASEANPPDERVSPEGTSATDRPKVLRPAAPVSAGVTPTVGRRRAVDDIAEAAGELAAMLHDRKDYLEKDRERSNRIHTKMFISLCGVMPPGEWFGFRLKVGAKCPPEPSFEFAVDYAGRLAHPKRVRPGSESKKNIARQARSRTKSAMLELRARAIEPVWDTVFAAAVRLGGASGLARLWTKRKREERASATEWEVLSAADDDEREPIARNPVPHATSKLTSAAHAGDRGEEAGSQGVGDNRAGAPIARVGDQGDPGHAAVPSGNSAHQVDRPTDMRTDDTALDAYAKRADEIAKAVKAGDGLRGHTLVVDSIGGTMLARLLKLVRQGREVQLTLRGEPASGADYVTIRALEVKVAKKPPETTK